MRPGKGGSGAVAWLNGPKFTPELRGPGDKFGRYMTTFRKLHTEDDTEPLAVVSGEPYRLPRKGFTEGNLNAK